MIQPPKGRSKSFGNWCWGPSRPQIAWRTPRLPKIPACEIICLRTLLHSSSSSSSQRAAGTLMYALYKNGVTSKNVPSDEAHRKFRYNHQARRLEPPGNDCTQILASPALSEKFALNAICLIRGDGFHWSVPGRETVELSIVRP